MFIPTNNCLILAATAVLVSNAGYSSAVPTGNKSIPLILYYIYFDNSENNLTFAGGLLPLRDIIVDVVNKNETILPHYYVTIKELRSSKFTTDENMGRIIQMFFANIIGTGGQCQQQCPTGTTTWRDNNTSTLVAYSNKPVSTPAPLYFGPERSAEARVIAQLAPRFNLVEISSQAAAADLSDRSKYPNFFRTTLSGQTYIGIPRALLNYLNYTTVGLIHLEGALGADLMQSAETDLRSFNIQVQYKGMFSPRRNETVVAFAQNVQLFDTRVFVFQSNSNQEYKMFCHAINTIGKDVFTAENYVFIFLMLIDSDTVIEPRQINFPNCTREMLDRLLNTSFVSVSPTWDNTPDPIDMGMTVPQLREQILNLSRTDKYGDSSIKATNIYALCSNAADIFWTGMLALDKLDRRLRAEKPLPRSLLDFTFESADVAAMLKNEISKVRFRGASGLISFDTNGRFSFNVSITQYIAGEGYHKRFTFDPDANRLTVVTPPTFATRTGRPPPDKKPSPVVDEAAARRLLISIICIALAAFIVACGATGAVIVIFRRRALARSLAHPSWLYDQDQFKMRPLAQSLSSLAGGSMATTEADRDADDLPTFPTALLVNSGDLVVKLQSVPDTAARLQINKQNHKIMTAFRNSLAHDSVLRFVGCGIFTRKSRKGSLCGGAVNEQYLIWEHCEKGSLEELIENQAFKLDSTFELAMLLDVAQGMTFLHQSKLVSVIGAAHGRLNPEVCLIDRRFSVKVAGYGDRVFAKMFGLASLEEGEDQATKDEKKLFWAPELLRQNTEHPTCSHASDVYAYGMSIYAVLTRLPPFESEANVVFDVMGPAEIVGLIRENTGTPLRPTLSDAAKAHRDARLVELMQRCWAEHPITRPSFSEVVQILRKVSNVKVNSHNSVTDQLLRRLERYASDMESLVAERTIELINEKRHSDDLLNRMLPPEIVVELKENGYVKPESYDDVTIYFSDIVGFTTISSTSSPTDIVRLLNALYTMFDAKIDRFDAYKVETIGDAYMVVSGLPRRNGDQHAGEIARLSLALLNGIQVFVIPHRPLEKLMLRIGLHSGPCVAGVVGVKMPRYCLFGDTVNTASRMESHGAALKIHISDWTKQGLDKLGGFRTEVRGQLDVKGKGMMITHWLMDADVERT